MGIMDGVYLWAGKFLFEVMLFLGFLAFVGFIVMIHELYLSYKRRRKK